MFNPLNHISYGNNKILESMAEAKPVDEGRGQRLHRRGIDLETDPAQRGHRPAHRDAIYEFWFYPVEGTPNLGV